jgi:myo-inositol 2-dehydrogenase / D-chiro-inositol 1-dehydrogenase
MPSPLRVGVVGCGRVAREGHLPALSRLGEVEVTAIADQDPLRLEGVGASLDGAHRHRDHVALLGDPAVDAVAVCVPAEHHVEVAQAAVEAGKHVLLEKPPALSLDQWDRLAAAVLEADVRLMLGMSMRWHSTFRAARDLVRTGRLGELRGVRTVLTNDWLQQPDAPEWRTERRRGGGALVEMGIHHLDLWRFLLDAEVEEVFALAQGDDESLAVSGRMENGVPTSSYFSHSTAQANEVEVYGEAGRLTVSPHSAPRLLPVSTRPWTPQARLRDMAAAPGLAQAVRTRREGGFYVGAFVAEWRQFADSVRTGAPVEVGLDSARRLLQVILAAAASTSAGRSLRCSEAPADLGAATAAGTPR